MGIKSFPGMLWSPCVILVLQSWNPDVFKCMLPLGAVFYLREIVALSKHCFDFGWVLDPVTAANDNSFALCFYFEKDLRKTSISLIYLIIMLYRHIYLYI